jgi:NAD(P)H-flavin reductase
MTEAMLTEQSADPMVPVPFCVESINEETQDTFTLKLKPANRMKNFSFKPGQFNMLYIFGVGEVPISISGDPASEDVLTHTIRSVGGVTKALSALKAGDHVGVRGPFGSAWPMEKAKGKDVIIVTGGIGLAPLRPAVYQFLNQREHINKFALLYGARTPNDILYREDIKSWRSRLDFQVRVTVDQAQRDWFGTVGVVTILIEKARFDPANVIALVCGPEIMMHFTVQRLGELGVKKEDIYISMERNMKCAVGFCGHCQYGPNFICEDGPVFNFRNIERLFGVREI